MAVEETEFTQVFRGYDKDEVDKSINGLRRDIINANNQLAEQAKENKRLLARIEELTAELEEVGSPTFSGLGTKLENTLRVAEEQSTRLIAQADHIPVHVGAMPWAAKAVAEVFAGEIREGDTFLLNDPYHGGSHLPDLTIIIPVFAEGALRFWSVVRAHQSDIGGATHGGYRGRRLR